MDIHAVKRYAINHRLSIFFIILFVSCIIPDGQQSVSDIYWPLATIGTYMLWEGGNFSATPIETIMSLLLGIALLISSLYSWSPGYSITTLLRLVVGFVWMIRFTGLTKDEKQHLPILSAALIIGVTLLSFIALLFPGYLSTFSIIQSPGSHISVIYMTLPVLPILLLAPKGRRSFTVRLGIIFGTLSVLLSFSVAALVLSSVLFGLVSHLKPKYLPVAICSLLIACLIILFTVRYGGVQRFSTIPLTINEFINKQPLSDSDRLNFVHEGLQAIRLRPLWGTGPGTFAIVSERFGETLPSVSLYAHDIWLTMNTEIGLAGSLIVLMLTAILLARKVSPYQFPGALWSIILILALSTVETSLDHYPVVILLAIGIGLLTLRRGRRQREKNYVHAIGTIILIIYIFSWIGSDGMTLMKRPIRAFELAPYREVKALQLIHSLGPKTAEFEHIVLAFHPASVQVDLAFANSQNNYQIWNTWMNRAIQSYPSNTSIQLQYLRYIYATQSPTTLCTAIQSLTSDSDLPCLDTSVLSFLKSEKLSALLMYWNSHSGPSKVLYGIGLSMLSIAPEEKDLALNFWVKARDLNPDWSYFQIELAALIAQINNDKRDGIPVLLSCISYRYAASDCQDYINRPNELPVPGSFEKEIMAIPNNLHPL